MAKYVYEIYSPNASMSKSSITYSYGPTKGISLSVYKSGFYLRYEQTVDRSLSELLDLDLVKDALKKVVLFQLIQYGCVSNMAIYARKGDDEIVLVSQSSEPYVYTLCGSKLYRKFSSVWDKKVLSHLSCRTKSSQNRLDAALHAFILSKSKEYVVERFIYLWMAMNGLYGYMASLSKSNKTWNKWIGKEYSQLKFFSIFYDESYEGISKEKRNDFIADMSNVLESVSYSTFLEDLKKNNLENESVSQIQAILSKYSNSSSVYMSCLILLPYYVRCRYFHSEKALPLFCFREEAPIPTLRILCLILEDFLENELYKWFDPELLEKSYLPRIQDIVSKSKNLFF